MNKKKIVICLKLPPFAILIKETKKIRLISRETQKVAFTKKKGLRKKTNLPE